MICLLFGIKISWIHTMRRQKDRKKEKKERKGHIKNEHRRKH